MRRFVAWMSVVVFSLALLVACAGRNFDTTHVKDIKKSVHTKSDISGWFGQPRTKVALTNSAAGCVERWTWSHAVAGGKAKALVVDFDAAGKVCDNAYSEQ